MHALSPSQPRRRREPADTVPCGDDLARARRFVDAARTDMDAVVFAERDRARDPGRDPHWLCERLTRIQTGAKRARARAVYRSAQDAMTLIHCDGPHLPIDWTQVDGRLIVLNKLLSQYEDGLVELEAAQPAAAKPRRRPDTPAGAEARYAEARETLAALTARLGPVETPALVRLMEAGAPVPVEPQGRPLQDAMPELVQRLLAHGRLYGKTLSVSYALDGVYVPEARHDALLVDLWDALHPLIAASMPLQGVGHLDIKAEGPQLRASGSGFADVVFSLAGTASPRTPRADDPFAPAPRITPDTEDALRAQLSALLDGAA